MSLKKIETPNIMYNIDSNDIRDFLLKFSKSITNDTLNINNISHKTFSDIWTFLEKYNIDSKKVKKDLKDEIVPKFKLKSEKIIRVPFLLKTKKYKYFKLLLAPSTIKGAGIGVFAVDKIPEGAKSIYKGIKKNEDNENLHYSWSVKEYNKKTGKADYGGEVLYYLDAFDIKESNWTRFVNCGKKSDDNNIDSEQIYNKIYYITLIDIEPKSELFIDYGDQYRKYNLKMKGKY